MNLINTYIDPKIKIHLISIFYFVIIFLTLHRNKDIKKIVNLVERDFWKYPIYDGWRTDL